MSPLLRKLARYATVSMISTSVTLSILTILLATHGLSAEWANVVATGAGTVPSFELNRRWVWQKRGRRSLFAEIAPYWILSFTGLGLSTLTVHLAAGWAYAAALGTVGRTAAADAANVGTFGSLWIVQYVILDRALFRNRLADHDGLRHAQHLGRHRLATLVTSTEGVDDHDVAGRPARQGTSHAAAKSKPRRHVTVADHERVRVHVVDQPEQHRDGAPWFASGTNPECGVTGRDPGAIDGAFHDRVGGAAW
jgi:putative flippase GtrA